MKSVVHAFLLLAATVFTTAHARAFWSTATHDGGLATLQDFFPSFRSVARFVNSEHTAIKFSVFGANAELFINGKKKAETTDGALKEVSKYLKKNDVIAFKCTKSSPSGKKAGLVATITHGGKTYRTGISRFTARAGFAKWNKGEQKEWNAARDYKDNSSGKKHDFCHWKKADRVKTNVKKFDNMAEFIWTRTGKTNKQLADAVFIRYIVGGEKCTTKPKDDAEDVQNKASKGSKGDDGDGDDEDNSEKKRQNTGSEKDDGDDKKKRTEKNVAKAGDDEDDKKKKAKNDSSKVDDDGSEDGNEKTRKKAPKSKGEGVNDNRGEAETAKADKGDDSDPKPKSTGRVPLPKDDDDDNQNNVPSPHFGYGLSGQNDETKPDGFCACRLTTRTGGECFSLKDPSAISGACTRRPCEPKFECVASSKKMCVKRQGGSKLVMISSSNCATVTSDEMETLLPYEE